MINACVNQTLSRTLLTAFTVFLVVMILFWFGGEGVHGFAFCMVIGVFVGCYSSIYIAAPILYWLVGTHKGPASSATSKAA
jgi:SecD/SecF fusion protein